VYIPTDWVLFLGIKKGQHVQLILDGNAKNFLVEPLKDLPTSPETEPKVKEKEVKS
jgi:phosphotransferase system HPr-like phosphotransfer protein